MPKTITFFHDIDISDEYIRRYELGALVESATVRYVFFKNANVLQTDPLHSKIHTKKLGALNLCVEVWKTRYFVVTAADTFSLLGVLALIKLFRGKCARIYWGYFPTPNDRSSYLKKALDVKSYFRYFNRACYRICTKLFCLNFDYGLYSGDIAGIKAASESNIVRPIQHWDMRFLDCRDSEREFSGECIVFLDENLPYHIDFKLMGWPSVDKTKYFECVNDFLQDLTARYGMQVKIAAHPKADLALLRENYRFEVIQGQTQNLIKNAGLVIAHVSTSVGMAAKLGKKIIVYCDNQQKLLYKNNRLLWMLALAKELGIKVTYGADDIFISDAQGTSSYVAKYIGISKESVSMTVLELLNE